MLVLTLPIFFPVVLELGIDPIWFGVTITVVTTLGAVTPPVGATTYVVGGMAKDVSLDSRYFPASHTSASTGRPRSAVKRKNPG